MKISTKSRYGLRVLIRLAEAHKNGIEFVKGKDLAASQDITIKYLEQIMFIFKKNGIITTSKGHYGGYALSKQATEISVLDVLNIFDDGISLVNCISDCNPCVKIDTCPTYKIWSELSNCLTEKAQNISVDSLCAYNR